MGGDAQAVSAQLAERGRPVDDAHGPQRPVEHLRALARTAEGVLLGGGALGRRQGRALGPIRRRERRHLAGQLRDDQLGHALADLRQLAQDPGVL